MAKSDDVRGDRPDTPFTFVKLGDPIPREWMARHPGWVRFPATMVVRHEEQASAVRKTPQASSLGSPAGLSEGTGRMIRPAAAGARVVRRRPTPTDRLPALRHENARDDAAATPWQDAIAAYRQATQVFDQAPATYQASSEAHPPPDKKMNDARERAFLHLLRWAENGNVSDDVAYHARFGGHDAMTDADMHDYKPKGEVFTHKDGTSEIVTAAGAYQVTAETRNEARLLLKLNDFTSSSQDKIATFLIKKARAQDDIHAGRLDAAFSKLNRRWSSLPGGRYSHHKLNEFREKFQQFLSEELK